MSELKKLASRLMTLDDKLIFCMKCGNCQAVCPMFGATHMEADVARGKLALIGNLAHEVIRDPEAVADKLGRCLLCGSCQANCPSGVRIMDIFMEARELVYAYLGLNPVKKMIFRILLAKPDLFNFTMRVGAPASHLLFRSTGAPEKTVCAPILNRLIGDRHIRSLPVRPLHAITGSLNESRRSGGLRITFFPGCMGDKYYVDMALACLKVFRHYDVAVYMPSNFACCGIPAISSGDAEGMVKELRKNLALLEDAGFDYLVTPCGSCTDTIREYWPRYAERINPAAVALAREIAGKAMDVCEFMVKVLDVKAVQPNPDAVPVTYHDSCHLKKGLGVFREPRTVIQANPAYRLVEMKEADRCCGCGGSFTLYHYDLAKQIGQRKRDNIVASGAAIVSAGCPACMMQMEDVLSHNADAVAVRHPVELFAETLK